MIQFDKVQSGVRDAILNVDDSLTVVWSPSEYPRPGGTDLVALRLISGPVMNGYRLERETALLPQVVRVTCTATADSKGVIRTRGAIWELEVEEDETSSEYRDRWLALLATPGRAIDAELASVGAASFDITANDLSSLMGFEVAGSCSRSVTTSEFCDIRIGDVSMTVEAQVFSSTRYLRGGAMDLATRLASGLELQSSRDILDSRGLVLINTSPITDITSLSGPGWESRAVISLRVGALSIAAEAIETIETVDTTLIGNMYDVDTETQTFTTTSS